MQWKNGDVSDMCFRFSQQETSFNFNCASAAFCRKKIVQRHLVKYNNSNGHIASKCLHTMGTRSTKHQTLQSYWHKLSSLSLSIEEFFFKSFVKVLHTHSYFNFCWTKEIIH